ncbi:MAG: long-chain fatty acid--CoA ligase [Rhodospirillaceae bacterium]|nr:long-chain fatty acid--CoA ligase [Rhodospirillaceae bacterium]
MGAHQQKPLWAKSYPDDLDTNLLPVEKPVYLILEESADREPNAPCLDFMDRKYTYNEVANQVSRAAEGLQKIGVQQGSRIGLCLPNSPYYVIAYFAVLKIGATVVNFNPLYTEDEINHQANDSDICMMITLDVKMLFDKVEKAVQSTNVKSIIVCSLSDALPNFKSILYQIFKRSEIASPPFDEHHIPFDSLLDNEGNPALVKIDPMNDIAVIQYTGGTTGIPKGAMLTHANVSTNALQVKLWLGKTSPGKESFLCVLPFFHVFAMTAGMNMGLITGSELILLPRFDLDTVLKVIHEKRPTIFPAVPTIYNAINNHPNLSNFDLTSIHHCVSGGASLPIEVKEKFEKLTGCVVVEGYGLTEASPVLTCNPPRGVNKNGSIGIALPGVEVEIRDLDDPTKPLPQGEKGELVARGPQVMAGYWNNPIDTAQTIIDGWLRTGDVGQIDEDGYIFLTDRLKDVIICSGYKVYPRIVEDALYLHPAVDEVIVIGINDEYRGEAPKAFVKLIDGQSASVEELIEFAGTHLNPIEKLAELEIRKSLPKTLIGKLSKKELVNEEQNKRSKSA